MEFWRNKLFVQQIQPTHLGEHFAINTKMIRKRLEAIRRNKLRPGDLPGEILKLGWETIIPYVARWLDIIINSAIIPSDWKRSTVVPIYKATMQHKIFARKKSCAA